MRKLQQHIYIIGSTLDHSVPGTTVSTGVKHDTNLDHNQRSAVQSRASAHISHSWSSDSGDFGWLTAPAFAAGRVLMAVCGSWVLSLTLDLGSHYARTLDTRDLLAQFRPCSQQSQYQPAALSLVQVTLPSWSCQSQTPSTAVSATPGHGRAVTYQAFLASLDVFFIEQTIN